jgi:primosomal protein N' (replication factor Y)
VNRDSNAPRYASIAVPIPLRRELTYRVPDDWRDPPAPGDRVRVPLGSRQIVATVVQPQAPDPGDDVRVKPISERLTGAPTLPAELLDLTRFVSDYYLCSWGEAIETALPPQPGPARKRRRVVRIGVDAAAPSARAVRQRTLLERLDRAGGTLNWEQLDEAARRAARALVKHGAVAIEEIDGEPADASENGAQPAEPGPQPTPAQQAALEQLCPALERRSFETFLLYGATGSGKTEVYLRAAEHTLAAGRSVIYMVPEIGLTPLHLNTISKRFPGQAVVMHSARSPRERLAAWKRVRSGDARLVVGTRSAVFAPVHDLGLVVIDEEQDSSYKQDETPRYNGRDLAVVRAQAMQAVVLMGTATPALETFRHARAGRYRLLRLGGRVASRPLAEVVRVDMRETYQAGGEVQVLSPRLIEELQACLARGEQALVLRNRRGWAVALLCPTCGERVQCVRCSLTLTWHRSVSRLRCHACGFETKKPEECARCGTADLKLIGEGSERVEDQLEELLPEARIARMDRDTVRRRGAHEALLRRFDAGEIDVLVGTQMIAKGHDFHRVTVVGVLSADQSLGLPDFRAGERTFQLLTQVAGRAGRGERAGRVIVQAFDPDHPVVRLAADQDYERFYEREIRYRATLRYPPVAALVNLIVRDADELRCRNWARILGDALRRQEQGRLILAGPGPAPIERIKNLWRQQILVRTAGRRRLVRAVDAALDEIEGQVPRRAIQVDVDPLSVL